MSTTTNLPKRKLVAVWVGLGLLVAVVIVAMTGSSGSGTSSTPSNSFTAGSKAYCQDYATKYHVELALTAQDAYNQCRATQDYVHSVLSNNQTVDTSK